MGKDAIKVVVLVVIIIVAFVLVINNLVCKRLSAQTSEAVLLCESCQEQFVKKVKMADMGPWKCPKCGKKTARRAYECGACGLVFTLPEMTEKDVGDPSKMGPARCPRCGSIEVRRPLPKKDNGK